MDSIFGANRDFGQIERVSPVFLVRKNKDTDSIEDFLFNIPFDVEKKDNELYIYDFNRIENTKSNFSGKVKDYGVITGKDNKKELPYYYGGKTFFEAYMSGSRQLPYFKDYESSEIFIEHKNVGIGKNIEGAFYVKIDYSLKEGFSFGVIIWLNEDSDFIKDGFVQLGGEQSVFLMKVNKLDGDLLKKAEDNPVINSILLGSLSFNSGVNKVVAISPLILNPTDFQILFASADYMITNELKAIRHARRIDDNGQPISTKKSQAIRMLPSGSVIYLNESFDFSQMSITPFKIGYNNILILNKEGKSV